jgi:hypothetical protein
MAHDEPPLQQMHEILNDGDQVRVLARLYNDAELACIAPMVCTLGKCVGTQLRKMIQIIGPIRVIVHLCLCLCLLIIVYVVFNYEFVNL